MIVADCRKDETYNQDFLGKNDRSFLDGYDWCVSMAVDNAFDNIFAIVPEDNKERISDFFDTELPDWMQLEYVFSGREGTEKRKVKTYGEYFRFAMFRHSEMQRNELITSMIESMTEEEYEANKAAAMQSGKSYCDTRAWFSAAHAGD